MNKLIVDFNEKVAAEVELLIKQAINEGYKYFILKKSFSSEPLKIRVDLHYQKCNNIEELTPHMKESFKLYRLDNLKEKITKND